MFVEEPVAPDGFHNALHVTTWPASLRASYRQVSVHSHIDHTACDRILDSLHNLVCAALAGVHTAAASGAAPAKGNIQFSDCDSGCGTTGSAAGNPSGRLRCGCRAVVHGGALDVENHTGKSHGIMEELHFECVWLRTLWACFAPHTFKMRTTP